MNKKVLVITITQMFETSSRIIKEAKSLIKHGYDVTVCGILYPNQIENEIVSGIPVRRYYLRTKKLPNSFFFQIFKLLEFYKVIKKEQSNADIIDCHCLYSLLVGKWLKKKLKAKKLILNAHELETEMTGLAGLRKKVSKFLEKHLIKKCDNVIVVSASIERWYKETYPKTNITCVYNAPQYLEPEKNNYFREHFNISSDSIIFLYQGAFASGRGIELILEAFSNLSNKYHVVFMGYGPFESNILEGESKYSNIHYHKAVPQADLYKYTSSADYGLSIIESKSLSYEYCMPNKLFEYTMFEVPVIVSNTMDQVHFVSENNIGYILNSFSSESLKELILSIDYNNIGIFKENMKKIRKKYSWDTQEDKLFEVYDN